MRIKFLGIFATLALLSACGTVSESTDGASAGGATSAGAAAAATTTGEPTVAVGTQEDLVLNAGDRIFFGLNQFDLSGDARRSLDRQVVWLQANPAVITTVEGHCDERGTREYNLALGERRANAVKDYLVAMGVDAGRITTVSYGKERPVTLGSDELAWSQNRRAVTTVRAPSS